MYMYRRTSRAWRSLHWLYVGLEDGTQATKGRMWPLSGQVVWWNTINGLVEPLRDEEKVIGLIGPFLVPTIVMLVGDLKCCGIYAAAVSW